MDFRTPLKGNWFGTAKATTVTPCPLTKDLQIPADPFKQFKVELRTASPAARNTADRLYMEISLLEKQVHLVDRYWEDQQDAQADAQHAEQDGNWEDLDFYTEEVEYAKKGYTEWADKMFATLDEVDRLTDEFLSQL